MSLYLQVFIASSRLLVSATLSMLGPYWDSSWIPVVALHSGDATALGLWVRTLHVLPPIIDGVDVGVGGPAHNPGSGPG